MAYRRVLQATAFALFGFLFSTSLASALSGSIDPVNHYAWDDNGGWVNWNPANGNVIVSDAGLSGYVWSAGFGWINLSPILGGVINANGVLSGFAWGANTGWIDFTGVTIDANGQFRGHTVPQSIFGTMTFDCGNCGVTTSWRPTAVAVGLTAGAGGNGPIAGSLSSSSLLQAAIVPQAEYAPSIPAEPQSQLEASDEPEASSQTSSETKFSLTNPPPALAPTSPPPRIQPRQKPRPLASAPVKIQNNSSFSLSGEQSVIIGNPIYITVSINGTPSRVTDMDFSYQLVDEKGTRIFLATSTIKKEDPSKFIVGIPTLGLLQGAYEVAVSAEYGTSNARQSLSVELIEPQAKAPMAEATKIINATTATAVSEPVQVISSKACGGFLSCFWSAVTSSLSSWWHRITDHSQND